MLLGAITRLAVRVVCFQTNCCGAAFGSHLLQLRTQRGKRQQIAERYFQGVRDLQHCPDREVLFTVLDQADIGMVQFGRIRQFLLSHFSAGPRCIDTSAHQGKMLAERQFFLCQADETAHLGHSLQDVAGYGVALQVVQIVAIVLAAVGALNWRSVGLFKFDPVTLVACGMKYGESNPFSRIVYILVAIAGVVSLTAIGALA